MAELLPEPEVPCFVTQNHNGFIAQVHQPTRPLDALVGIAQSLPTISAVAWLGGLLLVAAGLSAQSAWVVGCGALWQVAGWIGLVSAAVLHDPTRSVGSLVVRIDRGWVEVAGLHLMLVGLRVRREEDCLFLDDHEVRCNDPDWLEQALRAASSDAWARKSAGPTKPERT